MGFFEDMQLKQDEILANAQETFGKVVEKIDALVAAINAMTLTEEQKNLLLAKAGEIGAVIQSTEDKADATVV